MLTEYTRNRIATIVVASSDSLSRVCRCVKDGVNSNEKEGTTNDILLSLDSINVRDSHNFYVCVLKPGLSVLGCL